MKWIPTIIGMAVIIISAYVGYAYYNPYPCATSCCGCSSIYETFADQWAEYFRLIGMIAGIMFLVSGVFDDREKVEK